MNANTMLEVDTESFNRQELIDIYEHYSPGQEGRGTDG
jgi:hypothetical protein